MSGRPGTPETPFTRPPRGGPSERQRIDASAPASYCCANTDDDATATTTEATHSAASTRALTCRMLGIDGSLCPTSFCLTKDTPKEKILSTKTHEASRRKTDEGS